jgi:hypothetical protein
LERTSLFVATTISFITTSFPFNAEFYEKLTANQILVHQELKLSNDRNYSYYISLALDVTG